MRVFGSKEERTGKEKPEKGSNKSGIESFFQRRDNGDRVISETAKIPNNVAVTDISQVQAKQAVPSRIRKPVLQVVDPPPFHIVRATVADEVFLDHLKVREFVLQCILSLGVS